MNDPEPYQWMTEEEQRIWKIRITYSRHINEKKYCGMKIRISESGHKSFEYINNFKTLWTNFSTRSIAQRKRRANARNE
jgi:hypothetical protein